MLSSVAAVLQTLLKAVDEVKGRFLITADHGNAETMLQKDKKGNVLKDKEGKPIPLSSHTLVPVRVGTQWNQHQSIDTPGCMCRMFLLLVS
jgi:bisphosphoglycerate-independent phosphoglycerate mutase (AlkP superfamily)